MTLTVSQIVRIYNVDPQTFRKLAVAAGYELKQGKTRTFTPPEICEILHGDYERERTLETRERRKLLEKENAEKDGRLVDLSEAEKLVTDASLPVRQRLLALPSECAARCNPTDPQCAREALQRWVDDSLPLIRVELKKK